MIETFSLEDIWPVKGLDNSIPRGVFEFESAWLYSNDGTKWNFLDIRQTIFWESKFSLAHQNT